MRWYCTCLCGWLVFASSVAGTKAQERTAPAGKSAPAAQASRATEAQLLEGSTSHVYKTIGATKLSLHVFNPPGFQASDRRPAIVFFFGGGWTNGSPGRLAPQCQYLASRGMVAITADYRVRSRNQSTVEQSTADAKSAVRWVRAHAAELGIDPDRIAAGGGSAGGHLAAATATLEGADEPGEDKSVSAVPNALILFNPAVRLPILAENKAVKGKADTGSRFAGDPQLISPAHHIRAGQPPAIIFHGTADKTVPFKSVEKFRDDYLKAGNRCELVAYEGEGHGFFNWDRDDKKNFISTLTKSDAFLKSQGWLTGEPNVKEFFVEKRKK